MSHSRFCLAAGLFFTAATVPSPPPPLFRASYRHDSCCRDSESGRALCCCHGEADACGPSSSGRLHQHADTLHVSPYSGRAADVQPYTTLGGRQI
jgi:hypothetical protein